MREEKAWTGWLGKSGSFEVSREVIPEESDERSIVQTWVTTFFLGDHTSSGLGVDTQIRDAFIAHSNTLERVV